ncbi:hypothetical protein CH63R_05070 [Colletotrichum higginsianum IMI 349063]|uniref:Uncharacterized protein n=1 Tax=Colletotrichum higginsianum (strain IMI 349063) TaxID=759273 RepID=A0A1B7YLF0_COLHI|nr:hypothetical protein CH63R_05070 [Colletotrichum higginsianum IMI 349063]OBR12774.1 hypothetical protein CH63R_05070 [Colletotrichum higginsianum IMI 349063]
MRAARPLNCHDSVSSVDPSGTAIAAAPRPLGDAALLRASAIKLDFFPRKTLSSPWADPNIFVCLPKDSLKLLARFTHNCGTTRLGIGSKHALVATAFVHCALDPVDSVGRKEGPGSGNTRSLMHRTLDLCGPQLTGRVIGENHPLFHKLDLMHRTLLRRCRRRRRRVSPPPPGNDAPAAPLGHAPSPAADLSGPPVARPRRPAAAPVDADPVTQRLTLGAAHAHPRVGAAEPARAAPRPAARHASRAAVPVAWEVAGD